jgi:hypothetical protein
MFYWIATTALLQEDEKSRAFNFACSHFRLARHKHTRQSHANLWQTTAFVSSCEQVCNCNSNYNSEGPDLDIVRHQLSTYSKVTAEPMTACSCSDDARLRSNAARHTQDWPQDPRGERSYTFFNPLFGRRRGQLTLQRLLFNKFPRESCRPCNPSQEVTVSSLLLAQSERVPHEPRAHRPGFRTGMRT